MLHIISLSPSTLICVNFGVVYEMSSLFPIRRRDGVRSPPQWWCGSFSATLSAEVALKVESCSALDDKREFVEVRMDCVLKMDR